MQEDAEHKQPEPRSARAAHCVYNFQHLKQHPECLPQGTWPQNYLHCDSFYWMAWLYLAFILTYRWGTKTSHISPANTFSF